MKRLELGLSQAELARKIGIRRTHLSQLERGRHLPNPKTRALLEEALGIQLQTSAFRRPPPRKSARPPDDRSVE
jgi:transcriptional regulator with XRE-family HTH domain